MTRKYLPPSQSSSLRVCTHYRSKPRRLQRSRRWGQTQPLLHGRFTFNRPLYTDLYTFTNARAIRIFVQLSRIMFSARTKTPKTRQAEKQSENIWRRPLRGAACLDKNETDGYPRPHNDLSSDLRRTSLAAQYRQHSEIVDAPGPIKRAEQRKSESFH